MFSMFVLGNKINYKKFLRYHCIHFAIPSVSYTTIMTVIHTLSRLNGVLYYKYWLLKALFV